MENNNKENQEPDEAAESQETEIAPAVNAASDNSHCGGMNQPQWSVINFERTKDCHLTYDEAVLKINEYAAEGISGLCIITDNAAANISDD